MKPYWNADPKPIKKPKKTKTPLRRISLTNTSLCSNGERVTVGEIKKRLAAAYKLKRANQITHWCEGFPGKPAAGFAHIIAQARCKQIGKTELIWDLDNFFSASFEANQAIENPKGEEWKSLRNINHCLTFIHRHDIELYHKFSNNMEGLTLNFTSNDGRKFNTKDYEFVLEIRKKI